VGGVGTGRREETKCNLRRGILRGGGGRDGVLKGGKKRTVSRQIKLGAGLRERRF